MPAEAVALDIDVDDLEGDSIEQVTRIISDVGFQPDPHGEPAIGGIINFQPFEDTEANRDLLEECVAQIEEEHPRLDVSYELRRNKDRGSLPAKRCYLKITEAN